MKCIQIKCPYCGAKAIRRPASLVCKATAFGEEVCVCSRYPACNAYVYAHRSSRLPLGTLADPALRRKRRQAHNALDRLWKQGLMIRKEAYRWLQVQMGLPESDAHIGRFSEFRYEQVISLCDGFINACKRAA